MREFRYTLLSDGSSDRVLLPILTWLLRQNGLRAGIQPEWADLARLPRPPKTLAEKISKSLDLYPCELRFVHRDAEKQPREMREQEIADAIGEACVCETAPPALCVVPVRMQEARLLFDEGALRVAAGNPNGSAPIEVPALPRLEELPDPKEVLHVLLRQASGLHGRRLKAFPVRRSAQLVAGFIDDFQPLHGLPAFSALEASVAQLIQTQGWAP